jgi:polycomb protein EED
MELNLQHVKLDVTLEQIIQEQHSPLQIYAISFCEALHEYWSYFSTAGGHCVSVYRLVNSSVEFVQSFVDEDTEENFYCCCWAATSRGTPLLVCAGLRGILKVINNLTFEVEMALYGHGHAINDIRIHPVDDNLVFTASKDESIRLWNLSAKLCVVIFAGERGHKDEVLSLDVHILGNCFLSTGMDTSIRIWNLEAPQIQDAIRRSYEFDEAAVHSFKYCIEQFPLFSTIQIHGDYVDSARWFGDCILSKSTKNNVIMWAPDSFRYKGAPLILREFEIDHCNLWFIRMDVCIPLDLFAVGNVKGNVFLFSVSGSVNANSKKRSFKLVSSSSMARSKRSSNNSSASSSLVDASEITDTNSYEADEGSDVMIIADSATLSESSQKDDSGGELNNCLKARPLAILSHRKCRSTVRQVN